MVKHYKIALRPYSRGYHLITEQVFHAISEWPDQGLLQVFIKHTSAALCINENADPTVRTDFEKIFNHLVPENLSFIDHDIEGPDDMPAHIKAAMIGSSITIPIVDGRPELGIWQGIFLCEFRNKAASRNLILSLYY